MELRYTSRILGPLSYRPAEEPEPRLRPNPGYSPVRRGPSKARRLYHECKELRVAHLQGGQGGRPRPSSSFWPGSLKRRKSRTSPSGDGGSSSVPGEASRPGGGAQPTPRRRRTSSCSTWCTVGSTLTKPRAPSRVDPGLPHHQWAPRPVLPTPQGRPGGSRTEEEVRYKGTAPRCDARYAAVASLAPSRRSS